MSPWPEAVDSRWSVVHRWPADVHLAYGVWHVTKHLTVTRGREGLAAISSQVSDWSEDSKFCSLLCANLDLKATVAAASIRREAESKC